VCKLFNNTINYEDSVRIYRHDMDRHSGRRTKANLALTPRNKYDRSWSRWSYGIDLI